MSKQPTKSDERPLTPRHPAPGMHFNPFGEEVPNKPPTTASVDFGDGQPPVALATIFPRDADGKPIDPDASTSPDEPTSPTATPPLPETATGAGNTTKNTEPPHWYDIPEQRDLFCKFVMGMIDDYALFDRDEQGALKDWTCNAYIVKRGFVPADYATLTLGRSAIAAMLTEDFRRDLKALMDEHKYPVDKDTFQSLIGHATVQDALQKMTGKGIRAALTGKLSAIADAKHVDEVNANTQRQLDAEKPPAPPATKPTTEPPPVRAQPPVAIERALTLTGDTQWEVMKQHAAIMLSSGFMPAAIKSEAQILTIGLMGQALGIQPIVAINNINVIQGKPTVSPQLMLALIRRTGKLEDMKIEDDGTTCTVTMKRTGETAHVETFSTADAKAMQLDNKDNWRKQPKTMRKWRAISAAARVVFPDVIWGMYLPEELNPEQPFDEAT